MTRSTRSRLLFAALGLIAALVCVRLGFWQLGRLAEVREARAVREARLALPEIPLAAVLGSGETATVRLEEWRRVTVSGRWDYGGEALIRNRTLNGRPGVHVVTPLRPGADGSARDTSRAVVLVLRGWLPSPDAMHPGPVSTAESGPATGAIGVLRTSRDGAGRPVLPAGEGPDRRPTFAAIDVQAIRERIDPAGTRTAELDDRFFVQLLPAEGGGGAGGSDGEDAAGEDAAGEAAAGAPARRPGEPIPVPLPAPDDGPHLGYAIQWFSFAMVALVGCGAFLFQGRRAQGPRTP